MSKTYDTIDVTQTSAGIALLAFDRPEARNALNLAMVKDIRDALWALADDEDLRVLILHGNAKVFVSGADIEELQQRGHQEALQQINSRLFHEIEQFPMPTIAAVRGWALGGGCELSMACDLRVAGQGAKFGQPEVGLGIIPGAGASYRMPRIIGQGKARELILTGRIIDAQEAHRIGLVNQVVADDQVLESATALATEIAKNGALALRYAKLALGASLETGTEVGMTVEAMAQAVLFEDDDKNRRMSEFLARRKKS